MFTTLLRLCVILLTCTLLSACGNKPLQLEKPDATETTQSTPTNDQ